MFHPTVPGVLLELANISANIVAFQGERGLVWAEGLPPVSCRVSSGWS